MDAASLRLSQISFLNEAIEQTKARLHAGSAQLVVLYKNLKAIVSQLKYQDECRNKRDPNCWSDEQVYAVGSGFQRLLEEYNVKNSASHDLASHLVSLQQRLRAVLLKPVAIPSPKHNIGLNLTGRGRLDKIDSINMNRPFTTTSISASTLPPIVEEDVPSGASLQPHPQQQPQAKNNQFAKPKKTTHE
eukprot:CAMPEP_0202729200 /NCGR_PEP_ID=MMETSP1385-20130828/186012_1 /ASSEMBLY_ACC=CAM_ASM_000861 /TAXON_ID=933848 /ORGANISM="Elphidium margaritaceum" /LENGTH=188 /DNA_ID=CAMNT_0049395457 /DNA_START=178 /DNA_END=744 /DNA_ORIENTATION=+